METRQLTIDEVTASAMSIVKEATNEERLLFKQWCGECVLNMGAHGTWRKSCDLSIEDGSFKKPSDLSATIDLALYTSAGQEIKYRFIGNSPGRVHVDRFLVNATIINTSSVVSSNIDLSEDIYYYHVGGQISNISFARISYLAFPVDRQGFPLIPESNLDAYKMYTKWMWALRENNNHSAIDQAYQMWKEQRAIAKGKNKTPDEFRAKQAFSKYMSMVNQPTFNNG